MNVIVYGSGYWGQNYIKELAGNLKAVIEPDVKLAQLISNTYNVPVYSKEPPDDLEYDAAIIVTPPQYFVDLALREVEKGKYILLEKPFAESVQELLKLRKYQNQIMCGLVYLYNPGIIQLRERMATLPLHHAYSRRTNNGPVRSYKNVVWDLAVHDISIFNYLMDTLPFGLDFMGDRNWCALSLHYPTTDCLIYVSWHGGPKRRVIELVPVNQANRIEFDDTLNVYDPSPLRRMIDDFLTGNWDVKASYNTGVDLLTILDTIK